MAIMYATGWEAGSIAAYTSERWEVVSGTTIVTTVDRQHKSLTGVGGSYSMRCSTTLGATTHAFLPDTARWVHLWSFSESGIIAVGVKQGGTSQINVRLTNDGSIAFRRGATLVQTSVGAWNPLVPHWIAIFFDCRESPDGKCEVWIDGVKAAEFSGDTRNTTTDQWDAIAIHSSTGGGFITGTTFYDDIIVTDAVTGRLAEMFGCPIAPDGDTAKKDLVPSVGTDNFANVNAIPTDTATYNSAAVTGDEDRYDLQVSPAAASIAFINVFAYASRDGVINTGEISIESGAAIVYGTPHTLAASPAYLGVTHIWETDPDTTNPWVTGGINSLKAGFRFTVV